MAIENATGQLIVAKGKAATAGNRKKERLRLRQIINNGFQSGTL